MKHQDRLKYFSYTRLDNNSMKIIKRPLLNKFDVHIHNPHVKHFLYNLDPTEKVLDKTDCMLFVTDHDYYNSINFSKFKNMTDTRNFF